MTRLPIPEKKRILLPPELATSGDFPPLPYVFWNASRNRFEIKGHPAQSSPENARSTKRQWTRGSARLSAAHKYNEIKRKLKDLDKLYPNKN